MTKLKMCVFTIVSIFCSCDKNSNIEKKHDRIDREEWTKLQVGDILYFRSQMSVDTFLISGITNSYHEKNSGNPIEFLIIYYKMLNVNPNTDTIYNYLYDIVRFPDGTGITWKRFYEGFSTESKDTIMNFGNLQLNNVLVIPETYIDEFYSTDTKTVYYSNLYGVVQYELYNGEIFTLDNTCLQKLADRTEQ